MCVNTIIALIIEAIGECKRVLSKLIHHFMRMQTEKLTNEEKKTGLYGCHNFIYYIYTFRYRFFSSERLYKNLCTQSNVQDIFLENGRRNYKLIKHTQISKERKKSGRSCLINKKRERGSDA